MGIPSAIPTACTTQNQIRRCSWALQSGGVWLY